MERDEGTVALEKESFAKMDRGKVIAGLTMLVDRKNDDTCEGLKCCKIAEDALALLKEDCHNCKIECLLQKYDKLKEKYDALLKEQEAVEPKQVDLYGKDEWWGLVCVCPDCKAEWMSDKADTHFCPKCGQAVKWNDSD